MKYILIIITCLLTSAHAEGGNVYVKLVAGPNFLQSTTTDDNHTTFDTGYFVAPALGYYWGCGLRLEAEYTFRRNAISQIDFDLGGFSNDGCFQSSSAMANLFWDFDCCYRCYNFHPYLGVGLGYDFQQMRACNSQFIFSQRWDHFAWQGIAGLAFPIFCRTELTLEYRFHQGGCHFYSHGIGIGLTDRF